MKSDLDVLMQTKNLDALLVIGNAEHNPPMYYLTGGGHVSGAALIKKRDEEAVLFHQDMERGEAARSGLKCISYSAYPYEELLKQANDDPALAAALRFQRMFTDCGLTRGRVGLYGFSDVGSALAVFDHVRRLMPDLELVGEARDGSLFMYAMETKDEAEVARIRKMGKVTTQVVGRVAEYLTSREVRGDEVLLKEDGSPLTIADVKAKINLWLAELGAETPKGRSSPLAATPACPTPPARPPTCCAWARPSSSTSSRARRAAATSTISPAPGAWATPRPKRRSYTMKSKPCSTR